MIDSHGEFSAMPAPQRTLILGGTTDASALARALAGTDAVLSYAGRVESPRAQPIPTRTGGFGGAEGLARFLTEQGFTRLIDATHPFAAQMSRNAILAAELAGIPLIALEREAWAATAGDTWTHVPDIAAAARALPDTPVRVFLAIGRMHLDEFAIAPQHHYLLRLVDQPDALPLPDAHAIIARGPFSLADDLTLLKGHRITHIVAKNAGGDGARAKIDAARQLGLPIIMIDRPSLPYRPIARGVAEVMAWLHSTDLGV
jgi:precorrin-6A/cobalt-precorrin-6A reductase